MADETPDPADEAAALAAAGAWTNAFPDPIYGDLWPRLRPVQQRMRMVRARAAVAAARRAGRDPRHDHRGGLT